MKLYTHLQKGEAHPVFCEDFLMVEQDLSGRFLIASVMDGCSGGKETHFASTFISKSFRRTLKNLEMENGFARRNAESLVQNLIESLRNNFLKIREEFHLTVNELVSTVILLVYDFTEDFAYIVSIGDGTIVIDDEIYRIEQQNMPDYLAYHLKDDFDLFFGKLPYFKIHSPKNLAISTDGVDSFFNKKLQACPVDVTKELLVNDLEDKKKILASKIHQFYEQHNQTAQDDLAIVRVVF
ncbi:MAG: hypothetical protein ACJAWV_002830 [Flammeovirgaceae bacterium]|jgi:hypothetical protein